MDVGGSGTFEDEFGELYRSARGVALRILGSVPEAEDAAAEALTRALVRWDRVGSLPHRSAWVQRVAANVAIDVARRRGPAQRHATVVARSADDVHEASEGEHEVTVLRLALVAALAELPRRQREAVVLRHLVGYPEAEVAAALGVSANTAKKHLQRGMTRLRGLVAPEGGIDAAFE